GAVFFAVLAAAMLPAAFWAGASDKLPVMTPAAKTTMRDTLAQALRHRGFLVMSGAYFVCGLNLVFLTTHLPAYLEICGQDPMLSAEALAVIGAVNCVGALLAGWLGGRYPKHVVLGWLYILRSVAFAAYFLGPPTASNTLLALVGRGAIPAGARRPRNPRRYNVPHRRRRAFRRKVTLDGKVLLELGAPGKPAPFMSGEPFHRCAHTALSPKGEIYVSDGYGNSRVHKY